MSDDTGLDLKEHYGTIRKEIVENYNDVPIETKDLIQRVCQRILEKNGTPSAYDEERASVARYVHMITRSVISDYQRKKSNQNEHPFDPAKPDVPDPTEPDVELDFRDIDSGRFSQYLRNELEWEDTKPRRVFLLMRMGYKRSEIADILRESPRSISWYRTRLKRLLSDFANQREVSR